MTFAELRARNIERCVRWHPQGLKSWSLSDWAVATIGELGEACNIIKKLNRYRDGLVGNSQDEVELKKQLADEIADTMIYLDLLATAADIELERAVIEKFNRVSVRNGFPERL